MPIPSMRNKDVIIQEKTSGKWEFRLEVCETKAGKERIISRDRGREQKSVLRESPG